MKKNRKTGILFTITLLFFIVLLIGGNAVYHMLEKQVILQGESKEKEEIFESIERQVSEKKENLAMDFKVYEEDGTEVRLSDFKGKKPVVINFWASWCPPCKEEMPYFQEATTKYGNEVEILMVNLTDGGRETIQTANQFIKESDYDMKVLYDLDLDAANTYLLYSIPRTLFVTQDGNLYYDHLGMISKETLNLYIEKMIDVHS